MSEKNKEHKNKEHIDFSKKSVDMVSSQDIFIKNVDFSYIHDNLPCGMIHYKDDDNFTLTYMNNGFLKILKYTKEDLDRLYNNGLSMIIYPDDLKSVEDEIRNSKNSSEISVEFRVITKTGELVWILSKGLFNKTINEYVSVVVDITFQKKTMRLLTQKAEHDELTNLYNRVTSQILIENYIKYDGSNEKAVFFVLDVDNFKKINDTYGHPYADKILVDISKSLKSLCRSTDILCRAGGDEIIVFLKDISSSDAVLDKANDLTKSIAEVSKRFSSGDPITCSIGASIFPDDGNTFEDLYKKADIALYYSKQQGKARFSLYNKLPYSSRKAVMQVKHTMIDSKHLEKETEGDWLLWYAFNLLNESKDIPTSINLILSLLGQKAGVDRVYIFEYAQNHTRFRNTFEWCNDGINPEINNLQAVPISSIKSLFDKFDETNGLFYCKDIKEFYPDSIYYILEPQGITAVLQCELKSGMQKFGMLGFDYCHGKKYWSLRLVDMLTKFSYLISVHLANYRLKEYVKIDLQDRFPSL